MTRPPNSSRPPDAGDHHHSIGTLGGSSSLSTNPYFPHNGILPVLPDGVSHLPDTRTPSSNTATGASAAGVRALTSQAVAFYFRAPVKAFFRTRVDYLAYARALQEQQHALFLKSAAGAGGAQNPNVWWHWLKGRLHGTTPGVIASAIRHYGWRVVPEQVLPPLIANVGVGAVLYTSYLQILGRLHPESALASKRVYPPPSWYETFAAGFLAGSIQSVVAAPLDAVQARYDLSTGINDRRSMWEFSVVKLKEIGARGIFAGWGLSLLKDSLGSAVFFSFFEIIKAQGYYNFVAWYYGSLNEDAIVLLSQRRPTSEMDGKVVKRPRRGEFEEMTGVGADEVGDDGQQQGMPTIIRPHYAIEPAFLLLAGMGASVMQQVFLHPLSHIQVEHWERLEMLDVKIRRLKAEGKGNGQSSRRGMLQAYRDAYRTTWTECSMEAKAAKLTMRQWLYRGFWWNTIRQVPSTSAGLIIFELVRRKYGLGGDKVRINRDGYDILLN
ncbi:mitochondrial carrier domain-containing protein [Podospora australis]|uniref:Mitochondrial carrier domain-containing protein n=1 Tax=Podospora australis TaxID=1536484 RepID=A0AAN6WKS2_9PEZI|nr:mitochondrial carrier domain-containing protein [Podospora australis]